MLFNHNDIPQCFSDGLARWDLDFVNDFGSWINQQISQAGPNCLYRPTDGGGNLARFLLLVTGNSSIYNKCRDFLLAHEVAHIAHSIEAEALHSRGCLIGIAYTLVLTVLKETIFQIETIHLFLKELLIFKLGNYIMLLGYRDCR